MITYLKNTYNFYSVGIGDNIEHTILRTGALDEADQEILKKIWSKYHIGYFFDLRTEDEIKSNSLIFDFFEKTQTVYSHCPIDYQGFDISKIEYPMADDYGEYYLSILDLCKNVADRIADIFDMTSQSILFGCSAGKDRTGVVAALLQNQYGLSESVISYNYWIGTQLSDVMVKRLWGAKGFDRYRRSYHDGSVPIKTILAVL